MAGEAPPAWRLWSATLAGFVTFGAGVQLIPHTAQERFPSSAWAVGTAITVGSLSAAAARPLSGRAVDARGARPLVLLGALLGALGAGVQLAAGQLWGLGLGRLLVGAGDGTLFTAGLAWMVRDGRAEDRDRLVARFGLSMWGGFMVGPPVGAALLRVGGSGARRRRWGPSRSRSWCFASWRAASSTGWRPET